jgi:hypothetical protein
MQTIRPPAVAGQFYPLDPQTLRSEVESYIGDSTVDDLVPKALIAPHAGYSGPIAGSAYRTLKPARKIIHRVVLLGPSHRVAFDGLVLPAATVFQTPLGDVSVDPEAIGLLKDLPHVRVWDEAHREEHSLEVHLPFLQVALDQFTIVPIVTGATEPETVADVLTRLWGGPETLVVVSSDLSHYEPYEEACAIDTRTSRAIEQLNPDSIAYEQACGRLAIQGLLMVAQKKQLTARTLDQRNSGDTAGPRDRVVGYGAYAIG